MEGRGDQQENIYLEDRTVTVVGSILNYAGINQLVHDNLPQI